MNANRIKGEEISVENFKRVEKDKLITMPRGGVTLSEAKLSNWVCAALLKESNSRHTYRHRHKQVLPLSQL